MTQRRNLPPSTQILHQLTRMRRNGASFDRAWDVALQRIKWPYDINERHDWKAAMQATREGWRAAYERGEKLPPGVGVLLTVRDDRVLAA